MSRVSRLLLITFIESFATICVERGVYFFTDERLAFSPTQNLWLALAFGLAYVGGSIFSHRAAMRTSEKSLLMFTIAGQLLVHLVLMQYPSESVIVVGAILLGALNGLKWPLIESYISAGQSPRAVARAVGQFNISWAAAVPLALIAAGPLIDRMPSGLFAIPAALNLVSLLLCLPLLRSPVHLPLDHPDRPVGNQLLRWTSLLIAHRWLMLASWAMLWVLAALMPAIFSRLGFVVMIATALAGLVDLMRLAAFVVCRQWQGWHGRSGIAWFGMIAAPVGFALVLFGPDPATVLAGEILFGFAAGLIYYGALYYAMVVQNASVDAGGAHEALVGGGFAIGPAAGLLGLALLPIVKHYELGILVGIAPLYLLCAAAACRALRNARRLK